MKYNDASAALEALREIEAKQHAYSHASSMIYLDSVTAAPKGTTEGRGRTLAMLSEEQYKLTTGGETGELLEYLEANLEKLGPRAVREVRLMKRDYDRVKRIPMEEYVEYTMLLNDAESVWEKAKNDSDFAAFRPYLEKIVETNRRFAGYYDPGKMPYDALLNEYERGLDMETLDRFFEQVKAVLVPLIASVSAAPEIDDGFLRRRYPVEKQKELSDYLMEVMGIDRSRCAIAESEHPFTIHFNNRDVRITTHYYEDDLASSMYSVIHEAGHAIYELGCGDEYEYTAVASGVSMGIHESQSRFYENLIGRSLPFIRAVFPKLTALFPEQLSGVTPEKMYRAVNKGNPGLIRIEADELTYSMHIIIRYELEKRLIAGELAVSELPGEWNRLYKAYLGVDVPDDKNGVLQDTHWAGGSIGYFPSYSLGSAYGTQMLSVMERDTDVWGAVEKGDLRPVTKWLNEKIHRHAGMYEPSDLFRMACGEFDSKYYTDYLTKKFTGLYGL